MSLSSDLIAQFVKSTNDIAKTKTETTLYGTVVEKDGSVYVKLDGSDQHTPVSSTADVKDGERVMVMIKNHKAIITGNISSPAARTEDVQNLGTKITEVEVLVADKVSTKVLEAEQARITSLEAKNVTITGKLEAAEADISNLEADNVTINNKLVTNAAEIETLSTNKLDASVADITYATIDSLDATNAKVNNLEATYGDFKQLTTDNFKAVNADIDNLEADKLSASDAKITYATITDLKAANGNITNLQSDVADIDTLIFGSASGTTIQTSFANAVVAQLGNAQIKSAMIDTVSADKITAGDIITNNVRVLSEDGRLLISDETIQISDDTRVRVQIGKDAVDDYSINIWDASGNLMFSKGGITDSAIKEAIIRNDMVSETANISASKLDIDSLFEEINGSSKTIKSSKVLLDEKNQTLDVAFTSLTTDVDGLQNDMTSQGTQISAIQGQIASKIWKSDINEATGTLSDQYSTLEQEVDSISATVGQHTTQIANKADGTTVTNVSNKVTALESSLSGFQSTVSETYATKTQLTETDDKIENLEIGGRNLLLGSKNGMENSNYGLTGYEYADPTQIVAGEEYTVSFEGMLSDPVQTGFYINTYPSPYPQCVIIPAVATDGEYHRYVATFEMPNNDSYTSMGFYSNVPGNGKLAGVRKVKLEKGNCATAWTLAPEDIDKNIAAAKKAGDDAQSDVNTLKTTVSDHTTKITQNTKNIALCAVASEVETKFGEYSTTNEMNAAIDLSATGITNTVSATYATKTALGETNTNVANAQNSINNLTIGARNLLTNSKGEFAASGKEFLQTGHDLYPIFTEYGLIEYTISMDMKSPDISNAASIQVYLQNGSGSYHGFTKTFTVTTDWKRYSFTFTPSVNADFSEKKSLLAFYGTYNTGNFPHVKNIKLEKGNRATDWTPAPEDIEIRVSSAESSITQLSNKITANVTETTNLSTRMSTVEQTASDLTIRLDNQTIGGTNILRGTNTVTTLDSSASWANSTWRLAGGGSGTRTVIDISDAPNGDIEKGFQIVGQSDDAVIAQDNIPVTEGVEYTLSCYAKGSGNLVIRIGKSPYDTGYHSLTDQTTWKRYSFNVVVGLGDSGDGNGVTNGTTNVYFGNNGTGTMQICGLKMELGNVATDWTPSPYDTTSGIDAASKTATNYMNLSDGGLIVGNLTASTLGNNVLIDTDSVDIRNGDTVLASFGADTIILGQNSDTSTISLCGGAGTISALISEAATSYPKYDAIKIASQEINFSSQRCVANITDRYILTSSGQTYQNDSELYMLASTTSSGAHARLKAMNTNVTTGDKYHAGVYSAGYATSNSTMVKLYSEFYDASAGTWANSNNLYVYNYKTVATKPIWIQGVEFTGKNKVLWSGGSYMGANQTATLSEAISAQANGVVLVWSYYKDSAVDNSSFNMTYIPKHFVSVHSAKGIAAFLTTATVGTVAGKYVYVSDTTITGYDNNNIAAVTRDSGITVSPRYFVLRYVIGV